MLYFEKHSEIIGVDISGVNRLKLVLAPEILGYFSVGPRREFSEVETAKMKEEKVLKLD